MPYALILAGLVMFVSGIRDTQDDLFRLVKGDFTGQRNFVFWFLAILGIGAVGYVPKLKPISNAFLVLVIVVLFLSNQGFFTQFMAQIKSTETKAPDLGNVNPFNLPDLPQLTLPGLGNPIILN